MASTVDERVVEMNFQGSSFVTDIQKAVTALGLLQQKLGSLGSAAKEVNELSDAGKNSSLSTLASGVDTIKSKFSAMGIIGLSVLSSLASRAVSVGISLIKSLTVDPIAAGLKDYETKLNAIQTILANTQSEGTNLSQVTSALNQLNTYANKTVYNFSQMAQEIGVFTAAGVGLNSSVSSIKGIANLAALSGSSAEQATSAMYQLSQAIAAGRVKLQDWNSVVNAGLGGKVFQTALINTARVNGVAIDAMIKKDGSFRQSLTSGWLTSKILTQTLSEFTGDLSNAQLRAMGFTAQETAAIQKQAKTAVNSATQVRTITALMQDLSEEVGTAWSFVWQAIIGNINQATKTLSSIHVVLENTFTKPLYDFARLIQQFNNFGGRDILIKTVSDAFKELSAVIHIVTGAFQEVFPPVTASTLIKMAVALETFVDALKLSATGSAELKTVFVGLFSIIKIVLDLIEGVGTALSETTGTAKQAGSGFLGLLSQLAQFIINIRKALESGTALNKFFTLLGKVLSIPVKAIGIIVTALGGFSGAINKAVNAVAPFVSKIGAEFSKLAGAVVQGIESGNFSQIVSVLNQLLFGGVLLSIRKFITNLGKGSGEEKTGLFDTIKESFESLTGTLKTMQTALKSETLEKIAIAVALLTVSLVALSFIDVKNLSKALGAITIMFLQLLGALAVVSKISGSTGVVKMAVIGAALNILATAIVILAGAVAILSRFSWSQLERGLGAIAILLAELVTATALMGKNTKGLVASAYSMEVMAIALNILAAAVTKLGKLDFATLGKGIGSIAALLLILGLFNAFGGKGLISTAASMVIVGAALLIISQAVETLGKLSVASLVKGLVGIAAALAIIAIAMDLMPPSMILTAAGLLLVSTALVVMSKALSTMGGMSWIQIAKSLVLLAGSLIIIAAAMLVMTEALPGAAALVVVAAALTLLTPVLVAFSQLSWEGIAKALITLAGAFLVIAAAGFLLTPLIPSLLLLGAAITLLGLGMLAAGAGVALFGVGLTALAVAVTASGAAILSFVTSIIGLIPAVLKQVGLGILALAGVIGNGGPALAKAVAALLAAILTGIIKVVPLVVKAFSTLLDGILKIVPKYEPRLALLLANLLLNAINTFATYYPKFVDAGIQLIINLLNGITHKIPAVAAAAVNLIIAFIKAIAASELEITQAGANAILFLINGIANTIRADTPKLRAAGLNLASAIIDGMTLGIVSGDDPIVKAMENMAGGAIHAAERFFHINSPSKDFIKIGESLPEGTVVGVNNKADAVNDAVNTMGSNAINAMKDSLSGLGDVLNENMNLNPVITPVIDLTQAKKGFDDLSTISKSQLINATASASTATSISAANHAAATAAGLAGATSAKSLTFNQYNTSPTALSTIDIYRQTKNQLSNVKGALSRNANVG